MPIIIDITNKKFGKLTAVKFVRNISGRPFWLFVCDCGNQKQIRKSHVMYGATKSCGCEHKKSGKDCKFFKHGLSNTAFFKKYSKINERCKDKNCKDYKNYGGRGIKNEWPTFNVFMDDMYESYKKNVAVHGEKKTTIDRIDVNGNYNKDNCRWETIEKQQRNRRNNVFYLFNGKQRTIPEIAEITSLNVHTLYTRRTRKTPLNKMFI